MIPNDLIGLENEQLVEFLGDTLWERRLAASNLLFARGSSALPALNAGMHHDRWQVRAGCAALMDHLADDRSIEPLRRALHDPSPTVRRHAVHSLACQGCKIAPLQADIVGLLIERALTDVSIRVRRVSVHQLGLQPHDPRTVDALQTILQHDTDAKLRSRAQFALRNQLEEH